MKLKVWINDEAEERLMNLVAQGYYSEAWEFITLFTDLFNKSLYHVAGNAMNLKLIKKNK